MDLSCDLRFSFQISSCLIFVTLFYEVVCCFLWNGLVAHWVKASTTEDFESSVAVGKEEHLGSTPDSARLCALHPDLDQIRARHLCHHLSFLKLGLRLTWTYTSRGAVSGDPFKILEKSWKPACRSLFWVFSTASQKPFWTCTIKKLPKQTEPSTGDAMSAKCSTLRGELLRVAWATTLTNIRISKC